MTEITKIIAKNQITNGGPSEFFRTQVVTSNSPSQLPLVILLQAENEFSAGANRSPYMQDVIDLYRANGIVIRESYVPQFATEIQMLRSHYS